AYYQPFPTWIPHAEHTPPPQFDLYAVNWKIAARAFGMGALAENPWIREMHALYVPDVDVILINPKTADRKGLREGDQVICESQFGTSVRGVLHLTELIRPDVLGFAGNFGHRSPLMGPWARKGLNYNALLSAADGLFDPVIGAVDVSPAVKLTKA
ncbi:MAG TPA: molybdopterin dinucleotide binding domain-containing protein, partial [Dehalococcoidia bacterium]|nr:molybdopterin dinucleotide binding domain-containing protein [Dehalococcoidia bacterium]